MNALLQIFLGLILANFGEWWFHKYVLHGLGKNKRSLWNFHWHEHHRRTRRNGHVDPIYHGRVWGRTGPWKEAAALMAGALIHAPLLFIVPYFTVTSWLCLYGYFYVHRKAHLDPEWARTYLPWHYDHHMGRDQDANWCVTYPLADLLLGTRKRYLGTEREALLTG